MSATSLAWSPLQSEIGSGIRPVKDSDAFSLRQRKALRKKWFVENKLIVSLFSGKHAIGNTKFERSRGSRNINARRAMHGSRWRKRNTRSARRESVRRQREKWLSQLNKGGMNGNGPQLSNKNSPLEFKYMASGRSYENAARRTFRLFPTQVQKFRTSVKKHKRKYCKRKKPAVRRHIKKICDIHFWLRTASLVLQLAHDIAKLV